MKELDEVRKIFLAEEVDEETRFDNEQKIIEWERDLRESESIAEWREHDITKAISAKAVEAFKDLSMQLVHNRTLTDAQRMTLWGRQDACLYILSFIEVDAKSRIEQIHREIRAALKAT